MSMAPKDWKEQERTVTAAKTEILAALKKTDGKLDLGLRTVKSVQRGWVKQTNTTATINISNVNIGKSVVVLDVTPTGSGRGCLKGFTENSITMEFSGGVSVDVFWQVVEYY